MKKTLIKMKDKKNGRHYHNREDITEGVGKEHMKSQATQKGPELGGHLLASPLL